MLVISLLILSVFGLLAWKDFKAALTLLVSLSPAYLLRFTLGVPSTVLEGMILILFAFWLAQGQVKQTQLQTIFGKFLVPVLLLILVSGIGVIIAPDHVAALGIWKAYFIEPTLVFVMLRTTFTSQADWQRAFNWLSVTVIGLALFAIFQTATGLGLPVPWDAERRATSVFPYPNALGLWLAPIVCALLVQTANKQTRTTTSLIAAILGVIAITLSQTEAALVAIPGALVGALLFSKATMKSKICIGGGVILLAAAIIGGVPHIREKVLLRDYSGQVRLSQWKETVAMLSDRPLFGAGLNGYPEVFAPYHDKTLYEIFQYPHNLILNFWVEMGIFGVFVLLLFIGGVMHVAGQNRENIFALVAFAALLTMSIHGLVDVPFFKNDLAVLTAFFLALLLLPAPKPHPRS
ncbi:MAG TPA: O-antigen ligase family protein [bacterium]|nr:O-antigen ligase family protein [bacterium]